MTSPPYACLIDPGSTPFVSHRGVSGAIFAAAILAAGTANAATAPTGPQACFYQSANYAGVSYCASPGQFVLPTSMQGKVSSVKISAGLRVDLLEKATFSGRSVTLTASAPSLAALKFVKLAMSSNVTTLSVPAGAVLRTASALCSGTIGPTFEVPLSSASIARSASLPTDRKRVSVACIQDAKNPSGPPLNVLHTDQGTPLRTGTSWVWKPLDAVPKTDNAAYFLQMRQAGLNAVRVVAFDVWEAETYGGTYLQHFDDPVFLTKLRGLLEQTVNLCSAYGMYCIIDAHGNIDSFNADVTAKFWKVMAPYFANRTNVLFEEANEPFAGSGIGANYAFSYSATLSSLRSIFNDMRAAAPNTHIMTLTPTGINGWGYVDAMARVAQMFDKASAPAIDWTNTSVAYHLYADDAQYGSPNAENLRNLHASYPAWPSENNFPATVTNAQLGITDSWRSQSFNELYVNQTSEILGIGWSMWNINGPTEFAHNFPLLKADATSKNYMWSFDAAVPGQKTQ